MATEAMAERSEAVNSSRKDRPVSPGERNVVGIDIGKKRHAAAGLTAAGEPAGPKLSFANDRAGVDKLEEKLLKPLGGPERVLIGMEATGHYWLPVYFELTRRGYACIVINPIHRDARTFSGSDPPGTRGEFRTRIRKTKTDKLDALSIASPPRGGSSSSRARRTRRGYPTSPSSSSAS